jgi:CheY-like chemotaxis protein
VKKKLNCILLVDDNYADNFFHQLIIKKMDIAKDTPIVNDGVEALEFLNKKNQVPDLIFLDINMPRMNGWEFLEAYKSLDTEQKTKTVIIMLTTSENPSDKEKANKIDEVTEFKVKPLTEEMVNEIVEKHFSDYK